MVLEPCQNQLFSDGASCKVQICQEWAGHSLRVGEMAEVGFRPQPWGVWATLACSSCLLESKFISSPLAFCLLLRTVSHLSICYALKCHPQAPLVAALTFPLIFHLPKFTIPINPKGCLQRPVLPGERVMHHPCWSCQIPIIFPSPSFPPRSLCCCLCQASISLEGSQGKAGICALPLCNSHYLETLILNG